MRVTCAKCHIRTMELKKVDGNWRGECVCGFTFRGNSKETK